MKIKEGMNTVISKIKKDHASLSHHLYMFIFGIVYSVSAYVQKDGIVVTVIFSVLTLYFGARALYLYKNRSKNDS